MADGGVGLGSNLNPTNLAVGCTCGWCVLLRVETLPFACKWEPARKSSHAFAPSRPQ